MANSRASASNYEYATVDTIPDSEGYFTNEICPRDIIKAGTCIGQKIFFSVRETEADSSAEPSSNAVINVLLEFKCPGDTEWTEYNPIDTASSLDVGNRFPIEETAAGVLWRAGVSSIGFSSGALTFGFDW